MFKYLLLSLLAMTTLSMADTQTIRFGTDATYPPFESMSPSGQIQGFDIDVINAMCQQLKVQCTFTHQAWDSLIPALQLGKFDAMFGAMNITAEREQQVDFTEPYYHNTASIVAAKKAQLQLTPESLRGKTIGVLSGATFAPYLQAKYGNSVKVNSYDSEQTAFLDLTAGRIDAVMGDTPLIKHWLQTHQEQYEIVGQPIDDEKYFGRGYAIAVRKGNKALLNQLNQALAAIKANGTLQKINQQYFGNN
ncbi:MAG: transporter substrate-binding domain-containing protein [Coxiellaceae bacterium]|nr:MAG: transporter substrate-binding domain-containing protein [Coxiellaceae bacterium]